jgi:hypothetical protein
MIIFHFFSYVNKKIHNNLSSCEVTFTFSHEWKWNKTLIIAKKKCKKSRNFFLSRISIKIKFIFISQVKLNLTDHFLYLKFIRKQQNVIEEVKKCWMQISHSFFTILFMVISANEQLYLLLLSY